MHCQNELAQVALAAYAASALFRTGQSGYEERRQDANDRYDDQQLNEGEGQQELPILPGVAIPGRDRGAFAGRSFGPDVPR